jgi:ferredoxin
MAYARASLYVMSGTGNSLRVARWAADVLAARGVAAKASMMEGARPAEELPEGAGAEQLVGVACPTHGFCAPWHAIVLTTRASMTIFGWATPGISGAGPFVLAALLALRGYSVRGVAAIDMPSNWMQVHPALPVKMARAVEAKSRPRVERFAARIAEGQRAWATWNVAYEAVMASCLWPISILYLLFGKIGLAKLFFANNKCDGCGTCEKACPVHAIEMHGDKEPRPFWTYRCESCMRCVGFCPKQAIEVNHGLLAALIWACTLPVSALVVRWGARHWPALAALDRPAVYFVTDQIVVIAALFGGYRLLHWAWRVRAINALFRYLSLWWWSRRYREPDTKLKDLIVLRKKRG